MNPEELAARIRNIPDFPVPGIQFKDITTLLRDGPAFHAALDMLIERYQGRGIQSVAGIESRGFILSAPLAYQLGVGMVPIRKPSKLPAETYAVEYELEYGVNTLEIHQDAFEPGTRVLVVDDLLATGGTTAAACELVERAGGVVEEAAFLIELTFLNGREKLRHPIFSLIEF
jgi:adenine phosphoribosyltransferase